MAVNWLFADRDQGTQGDHEVHDFRRITRHGSARVTGISFHLCGALKRFNERTLLAMCCASPIA